MHFLVSAVLALDSSLEQVRRRGEVARDSASGSQPWEKNTFQAAGEGRGEEAWQRRDISM